MVIVFCAVESRHVSIRREAIKSLIGLVQSNPALMNDAMVYAFEEYVTRSVVIVSGEGTDTQTRHQQRLLVLLSSCAAYGENVELAVKEDLLLRSLILAHHPLVGKEPLICYLAERANENPRWKRPAVLG